jgi:hypothetical protein
MKDSWLSLERHIFRRISISASEEPDLNEPMIAANKILAGFACGVVTLICGAIVVMEAAPEAQEPPYVDFAGGVAGQWLRVQRSNTKAHDQRGWDPSYVSIVSDFRPVVLPMENGKFVIQFESVLPKADLP